MMLFKLAFRNIAKSIHDYLIYFATLVLGVAVFYVFNALDSQTVMLAISDDTREIVDAIINAMSAVSVFVSFILGFLIVYASSFLMKRRKKEFGLYMLLGMGKHKVSAILLIETLYVGFISLVAGLFLGIFASQGMSVVVANLFKADMTHFHFTISEAAIIKTLVYFAAIFVVVIIFQTFMVSKNKLINLLSAEKKSQKNYAKNPVLCVVVFAIGAVLLGTAYYKVTAGFSELYELKDIGAQIVKGIIGNFAVFWAIAGLLLVIVKSNKKFYNKGLNCFTTKEIAGRINTSVFAGGIISLLLFFTISILSCSVSVKNSMDKIIERKTPFDVAIENLNVLDELNQDIGIGTDMMKVLEQAGTDTTMIKDVVSVNLYISSESNLGHIINEDILADFNYDDGSSSMNTPIIYISDYNRLAEAYGIETYKLEKDEYMIISDYSFMVQLYNEALSQKQLVTIGGNVYKPAYGECKDGFVAMSNSLDNSGILILPDGADVTDIYCVEEYVVANYNLIDGRTVEDMEAFFSMGEFYTIINDSYEKVYGNNDYSELVYATTKRELSEVVTGLTVLLIFVGLYLGIIFLISSGAMLSLKELSEAADSKDKYAILRRIGVDEKQIRRSLMAQTGLFFGLPLCLAIIHSVFGIQTALKILAVFGKVGLLGSICTSAGIILLIYGIYFEITYSCNRKIISE